MKKIMILLSIMLGQLGLHAQNSNFEILKSKDKEIVYKGEVTFDDIQKVPAFGLPESALKYDPDPEVVHNLKDKFRDFTVVVFLGSWCSDSHQTIPQLKRVLTDIDFDWSKMHMYALDQDKKGRGEEVKFNATMVPTIIVFKDNKEIGRITETVQKSVESDLLKIVSQ